MLSVALAKAKKDGGKKVAINFQVPIETKEEFEKLCKLNGVSVTSMLNGLIETALDEAQGVYFELTPETLLSLNNRIKELEKELSEYFIDGEPTEYFIQILSCGKECAKEINDAYAFQDELNRLKMIFKTYERSMK